MQYPQHLLNYFASEGEQGVTSTSASHLSAVATNMAVQPVEFLNGISFVTKSMQIPATSTNVVCEHSCTPSDANNISPELFNVARIHALVGWFNEARKAKEELTRIVNRVSIVDWAKDTGETLPSEPDPYEYRKRRGEEPKIDFDEKAPAKPRLLSGDEAARDFLTVKEQFRLIELNNTLAVLRDYLSDSIGRTPGRLAAERRNLAMRKLHPSEVIEKGQDTIIYTYTPGVEQSTVDNIYFALQQRLRSLEAEYNGLRADAEKLMEAHNATLTEEYNAAMTAYNARYAEADRKHANAIVAYNELVRALNAEQQQALRDYNLAMDALNTRYNQWLQSELARIKHLKIRIPNAMADTYDLVREKAQK